MWGEPPSTGESPNVEGPPADNNRQAQHLGQSGWDKLQRRPRGECARITRTHVPAVATWPHHGLGDAWCCPTLTCEMPGAAWRCLALPGATRFLSWF